MVKETNASVVKSTKEIKNNFYFKFFHPVRHYSLETVFCTMPKLSDVAEDEVLNAQQFGMLAAGFNAVRTIPVHDVGSSLMIEVQASQDKVSVPGMRFSL